MRNAREAYAAGNYAAAMQAWPGMFHEQRRALRVLQKPNGKKRRALAVIDRNTRQFYVSAFQSELFNRVVARRLDPGLDTLLEGDLAWIHGKGAVFSVTDAAVEQPRATALELSPSGPLFGPRMTEPAGVPADIEHAVLAEEKITRDAFGGARLNVKGARRPLRFPLRDAAIKLGADPLGAYLELRFKLPRGCYATNVLRELFVLTTGESHTPAYQRPGATAND